MHSEAHSGITSLRRSDEFLRRINLAPFSGSNSQPGSETGLALLGAANLAVGTLLMRRANAKRRWSKKKARSLARQEQRRHHGDAARAAVGRRTQHECGTETTSHSQHIDSERESRST